LTVTNTHVSLSRPVVAILTLAVPVGSICEGVDG
jgi:hypothetical protein